MKRTRILQIFSRLPVVVTLLGLAAVPALANGDDSLCSVESIAGNWLFATEVGQQMLFPGQEGDITALGTMNIDREGNLSGEFDVTVAEFVSLPDRTYSGSVTVDPDCRGTLTFVTGAGNVRTDSIAVLNESEMWGMTQDPASLWTYRVRRISKAAGPDAIASELAAMKLLVRRMAAALGVLRRGE